MQQIGFGFWNWVAVLLYLLIMLAVGAYFTKRASQSTDSFFTASGRLPSWAVGFFYLCNNVKCDYIYVYTRKAF